MANLELNSPSPASMSALPSISVIIPAYNVAPYIEEAVRSVLAQSLNNIEIIIIDDGSTDETYNIITRIAADNSNICVISHENRGVGMARNEGIAAATGEYIAFLDPDDRYPSGCTLEILYKKAIEHNVNICGGELQEFSNLEPKAHQNFSADVDGFLFSGDGITQYSDYQFDYGFYRFIYKRDLLLQHHIEFPPYARFQDPPFMVRAFLAAGQFYALHLPTYALRVEHKTISWSRDKIDGLYSGIRDVWQLACTHRLPRLQHYTWLRIRNHYPSTGHMLTPAQQDFINNVEQAMNPQRRTMRYWLFSKDKNFADPRQKTLTILGRTYTCRKRK